MAIREGRWDCPSCGSKAVFGRHVDCPGCGKPRPAGIRFYLTDDAPAIVDAAQLAQARAGADWICEHCEASNRATQNTCGGCGAARGTSPTQPVRDFSMGAVPRSGDAPAPTTTTTAPSSGTRSARPIYAAGTGAAARTGTTAPASGLAAARGARWLLPGLAAVFVGLLVLIGLAALTKGSRKMNPFTSYVPAPPVPAVVAGKRWDRRIEARILVEMVPGEGYALPEGAQVLTRQQQRTGDRRVVDHYVTSTRQVERTVQVPDGYETVTEEVEETVQTGSRTYVCGQRDLGNGYFEDRECSEPEYETRTRTVSRRVPRYRDETRTETVTDRTPVYGTIPVYRTWYTWNQPVWRDTVYTASGDTTQPEWPQVEPVAQVSESGRSERYTLLFRRGPGEDLSEAEVTPEEWARYQPGQPVAIRDRTYSIQLLPADSLPACIGWHAGRAAAPPASLGCSPRPDSLRTDSLLPDSVRPDSAPPDSAT